MPLANPELSENMGFAHFPKPPPIDVQSAARAGWCPLVFVPGTRRSSVRKPGPPPPDRCPSALSQQATEADCGRPHSVGLAMRRLERLAICFGDRQARNCHCRDNLPLPANTSSQLSHSALSERSHRPCSVRLSESRSQAIRRALPAKSGSRLPAWGRRVLFSRRLQHPPEVCLHLFRYLPRAPERVAFEHHAPQFARSH